KRMRRQSHAGTSQSPSPSTTGIPTILSELLDPKLRADDFVAVDDDSGNLVGYFHYKPPHHPSLEIGLGMHPDWTGRGLGQSFVEAGLRCRPRAPTHSRGLRS